jgi:hypothetical protein
MKFHQVGAELLHADGRTDLTKLTVAFRSFPQTHKYAVTSVDSPNSSSVPTKPVFPAAHHCPRQEGV